MVARLCWPIRRESVELGNQCLVSRHGTTFERERFQTTRDRGMYRSTTQRRHHDAGSYWIMDFLPDMESKDRKHQQGRCSSCKGGSTAAFAYLLHEVMCRGLLGLSIIERCNAHASMANKRNPLQRHSLHRLFAMMSLWLCSGAHSVGVGWRERQR